MPTNPNPELRRVDDVRVKPTIYPKVAMALVPTEHTEWVIDGENVEQKTRHLNRATRRGMLRELNRSVRRMIRHPKTMMGPQEN